MMKLNHDLNNTIHLNTCNILYLHICSPFMYVIDELRLFLKMEMKWNYENGFFLSWNCANYSSLLYTFRSFRMFENICHCDGWKCWRNRICNFQLLGRTRYRFRSNTGQIICTSLFSVFIENHLLVIFPWLLSSVKPTTFGLFMSEKVFFT